MTLYDDVSGRYIDVEVKWDGRGRMPHETGEGWQQKANVLLEEALGDLDGDARRAGGAGRGHKGEVVVVGATCPCGGPIARHEVRRRFRRCRACRKRREAAA